MQSNQLFSHYYATFKAADVPIFQYYATVDPGPEFSDDNIPWLSKTHVEDRSEPDPTSLQEMAGSGHSVGGIINTNYSGVYVSQRHSLAVDISTTCLSNHLKWRLV